MCSFSVSCVQLSVAVCFVLQLTAGQQKFRDPNIFCFGCAQRRNHRDLYANPDDCHTYYQCFYTSETSATGIIRSCPPNTFFHEEILQCLPEGKTPCSDLCQEPSIAERSCYLDSTSCSSYFVCSNTASVKMCCPPLTSFNESSCSCNDDATCTAECILPTQPPTTVLPPTLIDNFNCVDSFGTALRVNPDDATSFFLIDTNTGDATKLACALGTSFDVVSCRCANANDEVRQPPPSPYRQCSLYLPFDDDLYDHSINKFKTFAYGNAELDNTTYARGGGSLRVSGGRIEIPGLKTFDLGSTGSWCFYYRCARNNYACTEGGILSNLKSAANNSEFSHVSGIQEFSYPWSSFVDILGGSQLSLSTGPVTVQWDIKEFTAMGFGTICVSYDGQQITIHHPYYGTFGRLASGKINIGNCPYVVGTDAILGDFNGWIDEVLICDHALTGDEADIYFSGRPSMEVAGLIPKELPQPPLYTDIAAQPGPNGQKCGHNKYWYNGENIIQLGIIGGQNAKPDEFPSYALMYVSTWDGFSFYNFTCGGTVVSKSYVLTHSSCCQQWSQWIERTISVYYGVKDYKQGAYWDHLSPQNYAAVRQASQIIINPDFFSGPVNVGSRSYTAQRKDFCIVKVSEPVSFNTWQIQPVCLPRDCDDTCSAPGSYGQVAGYGLAMKDDTNPNSLPENLQVASIPIISQEVCNSTVINRFRMYYDQDNSFCVGQFIKGGVGECDFDVGDPFYCSKNGYFSLDGVNSWAVGCAEPRFVNVYSKVCTVLDWLHSYIDSDA